MRFDPERHRRRSMRLKGYDYSQAGAYFVTICTQGRACLFGEVVDGEMRLNDAGRMVVAEWERLPALFPNVVLDAFVVMPNHIHGIVILTNPTNDAPDGATLMGATAIGATTRVAPTMVGNDAASDGATGATTRVAPTTVGDDTDPVGAGLVPAPSTPDPSTPATPAPDPSTPATPAPAPSTPATPAPAPPVPATPAPAPPVPAPPTPAPSVPAPTLGDVIGAFKSRVTVEYARGVRTFGWTPFDRRLWQRNYYEHIIRNEEALNRIRRYIVENPIRWAFDRENPFAVEIESEETWLH
jgi:putative transposase